MTTPIHVTDDEFDEQVLRSDVPVLVDFWAPWCGPCRFVAPVLDELASDYNGRVVVAKINTDDEQAAAVRFGIQGIPTIILFHRGKEIDRVVGAMPKHHLERWIDSAISA